jgi:predicted ATPase
MAVQPAFRLTDTNAGDIARITRRVDGLPLAIELAAARMSLLTPAELETRLTTGFDLLNSSGPGIPARQQTVTRTLDWSWKLLTADEQSESSETSTE